MQRMKAILLRRNTQQRQNVLCSILQLQIHQKTVRKEGTLVKCFSTLEEKFRVFARPRNMLYLFLE